MARRLELKTVTVRPVNGADSSMTFSYGEMLKQVLERGVPPGGIVLADVIKAVNVWRPIEDAMVEGKESVVLTDQQYQILREKLNEFKFTMSHWVIAEFGEHVLEAPEIT